MTETVAIDRPSRHDLAGILNAAALPLAVVLLGLFFYIKAPVFLTPRNLLSITVQVASLMTIAVPFAILLMILSAVVPYLFFKRKGWL